MSSEAHRTLNTSVIIRARIIGENISQNLIIILCRILFLLNFFQGSAASFKCRRFCLHHGSPLLLLTNSRRIRNIAVVKNSAIIQLFQYMLFRALNPNIYSSKNIIAIMIVGATNISKGFRITLLIIVLILFSPW